MKVINIRKWELYHLNLIVYQLNIIAYQLNIIAYQLNIIAYQLNIIANNLYLPINNWNAVIDVNSLRVYACYTKELSVVHFLLSACNNQVL